MVKGAVLVMLADTQAAHAIGGFKVGVGFALRRCRDYSRNHVQQGMLIVYAYNLGCGLCEHIKDFVPNSRFYSKRSG